MIAAPVMAQTYDCNIRQRSWAGLISESYRFEIDAAKGRVSVLDPIIRFSRGKPVKGALEVVSEEEQRVTWEVKDVPIAPEGGPTDARFEAILTEGETLDVQVKALWTDESDAGTGKGRCTPAE
ncbi:MAG: hypothetical protein GYB25_07160 [Rhodobacteraceae bacterium]|nr:hypothetical protein [Paracoccaceae bacterium]